MTEYTYLTSKEGRGLYRVKDTEALIDLQIPEYYDGKRWVKDAYLADEIYGHSWFESRVAGIEEVVALAAALVLGRASRTPAERAELRAAQAYYRQKERQAFEDRRKEDEQK